MKSILYTSEMTPNRNRKFGAASFYYPSRVMRANGTVVTALFTEAEINSAISRARANGEDFTAIDAEQRDARRALWISTALIAASAACVIAVAIGVATWSA
jgi:hypothetical protein